MARVSDADRQLRLFPVGPYQERGRAGCAPTSDGSDIDPDPDRWKPVMSDFGSVLVRSYLAGPDTADFGE